MRWFCLVFSLAMGLSSVGVAAASPICDFDGDGMSELVVVNSGESDFSDSGLYDWLAFNPRQNSSRIVAQDLGSKSSKLIPGNWVNSNRAVAAVVNPIGSKSTDRATWSIKSPDYLGGTEVTRNLGRSGDLIIQGGDYDGNGITDSLILKRTTGMLGLRVNYFLSSYNGNNLGKERLYKALGAPFKDANFHFSPDGHIDYLAVFRRSRGSNQVLKLKPFTDSATILDMGSLPGGARGPIALKQGTDKGDLLAFYLFRNKQTLVIVKNLAGREIARDILPGIDGIVAGDFFEEPGWEIGIENGESVTIFNPTSRVIREIQRPPGISVSCVSNQFIE